MKKLVFWLLLLCLPLCARAEGDAFSLTSPESMRPYAGCTLSVHAPRDGLLRVTVEDGYIEYEIACRQAQAGDTDIAWDGLIANGEAPRPGGYTLRAEMDGVAVEKPLRVLLPAAALQYCIPSGDVVYAGYDGFLVNYLITGESLLYIRLAEADAPEAVLKTWSLEQGDGLPHLFHWNGQVEGRSVPAGRYTLSFSLKNGTQAPFTMPVTVVDDAPPTLPVEISDPALFLPESADSVWDCLMAPVTVVDIGLMQHQNIYSAPDGKSAVIGTMHGQSHGVLVLELRADGFARIGTWRQEDGDYVEGYVPAGRLKTVAPNPHYGLVIDKNEPQTMQIWQDGKKLGEIAVSTGLMAKGKTFRETLAGAFLTTDRMISFKDEGYQYNYALRIDGGNLIHSLGCKLVSGKFDYSEQLQMIGSKSSHGCVRCDPRPGENGLNVYWLWTHLPYNTKVLVLDDPGARAARLAELTPTQPPTAAPTATPAPTITAAPTDVPSPTPEPAATPDPTATPEPTDTPEPAFDGLLTTGSKGVRVTQLQERLRELGYYAGAIDGAFGGQTRDAVVAFQRNNRLSADGMVGPKTYAVLSSDAAQPVTPVPTRVPTAAPTAAPTPTAPPALPEFTAAPGPSPSPTPSVPPETTIVISLAGDTLLGSEDGVRKWEKSFDSTVAREGMAYPLRNFAPLFASDDITFLNLECVLKDNSKDKTEGRLYNFRGPTSFTGILTAASVEHVNIANNHYIDYGYSGRRTTREALTAAGITYSGYTTTQIYEKDGIKIGFAGIRETVWKQDRSKPAQEIRELRDAGCDYILYACHFGNEYEETHNELQTQIAHAILDAGADCIVGAHPHVVQGVENYGGKPIFYSLGNFVFGGNLSPTDYDGLAAQLTLHFTHGACDGVSVRLIPLLTSGVQDGTTDFCPVIAQGEDKARILGRISLDSQIDIAEEIVFIPEERP